MNPTLRTKLEQLEQRAGIGAKSIALVYWHESKESQDELEGRIARWQAGEAVEGVSGDYRHGMSYHVIKFVPVRRCN